MTFAFLGQSDAHRTAYFSSRCGSRIGVAPLRIHGKAGLSDSPPKSTSCDALRRCLRPKRRLSPAEDNDHDFPRKVLH